MKALLVVFTDPVPGQEDAYNHWYTHEHLPDCLAVPGYVRATRYRAFPGLERSVAQEYLSLYELELPDVAALERISAEHMRRIADGVMRAPPPNTISNITMRALYYTAPRARFGKFDAVPEGVFLVLTDPTSPELENSFNDWYSDIHLPEVCSVPPFVAATRYRPTAVNMLNRPWVTERKHLAVYELGAPQKSTFEAGLAGLSGTIPLTGKVMDLSTTLDRQTVGRWAGYRVSPRKYCSETRMTH